MRSSTFLLLAGTVCWISSFILAALACDPNTYLTVDFTLMKIAVLLVAIGFPLVTIGAVQASHRS